MKHINYDISRGCLNSNTFCIHCNGTLFCLVFYPKAKINPTKCPDTKNSVSPLLCSGSGWYFTKILSISLWYPQIINRLIFTVLPLYRWQTRILVSVLACGISNFYLKSRRACWYWFEGFEIKISFRFYDEYLFGIFAGQSELAIWIIQLVLQRLDINDALHAKTCKF